MKRQKTFNAAVVGTLTVLCLGAWGGCAGAKRFMYEGFDRDAWQQPAKVIATLALAPGQQVADIGAGGGYFTLPLAKAVGETGRVFAVDVEADMVKYVLAKRHEFLERQSFQIFVPGN
jgi:ubiquinone/menaquinone biosynthesis C-methylase UbiE